MRFFLSASSSLAVLLLLLLLLRSALLRPTALTSQSRKIWMEISEPVDPILAHVRLEDFLSAFLESALRFVLDLSC